MWQLAKANHAKVMQIVREFIENAVLESALNVNIVLTSVVSITTVQVKKPVSNRDV